MKKIISAALSLLMVLGLFASCGAKKNEALANATAYLENMYQTGTKGEAMNLGMDKDVLAAVAVDGVSYSVEWTVTVTKGASDSVKIAESEKANHVKIDIPDLPEEDILFTATATVKDAEGNSESVNFSYSIKGLNVPTGDTNDTTSDVTTEEPTTSTPANNSGTTSNSGNTTSKAPTNTTSNSGTSSKGFDPTGKTAAQIMEAAYKLGRNEFMLKPTTLTGKVIGISKPYDAQYGSVTVVIVVDGSGKNIVCYNMKGNDTDKVKAGDTITVTGYITNFYYDAEDTTGEVEFTYHKDSQTEVVMNKRVAGKEEAKTLSIVNSPVAGTKYKFGMVQKNIDGGIYCLTGNMEKTYYFGTTTAASLAIDVTLESTTGGYYLSTTINGAKKYINMVVKGTHENAVYEDAASTVYTYDATLKTLVTTLNTSDGAGKFAFASYGTFTTVCPCNVEDDKEDFYCHFYK